MKYKIPWLIETIFVNRYLEWGGVIIHSLSLLYVLLFINIYLSYNNHHTI
jgi:uncharacterized protein (DUF1919 family)